MSQATLFAEPLIAGLEYRDSFITSAEESELLEHLKALDLAQALLIRYDPGAGIGWHRDRPVFDKVVGISLNTPARLRFRRRTPTGFDRLGLDVAPRSAYLLSGEARHDWEHSIAPGEQLRFSITFRTLSDLGRSKAQRIS